MIYDNAKHEGRTFVTGSKTNYSSSEKGMAIKAVPRLKITDCQKNIKKNGSKLYIDSDVYDLSELNVLDFCKLLKTNNITISFLDNHEGWELSAECICDFNNNYVTQQTLSYVPFDMRLLNTIPSESIIPLDNVNTNIVNIVSMYGNIRKYVITSVDKFENTDKLVYSVQTNTFLLKINHKFLSTNNAAVLAKHLVE